MKRRALYTIIGAILAAEAMSGVILHLTDGAPASNEADKRPAYVSWDDDLQAPALVPNYKASYADVQKTQRQAGWLKQNAIQDVELALTTLKPTDTGVEIDAQGMRKSARIESPDATLLFLGDAVSFGTLQGKSLPDHIEKLIQDNAQEYKIEVLNASIPGQTTKDALNRLPALADTNPDVVAIYLGLSDFYQKRPLAYTVPSYTLTLLGVKLPQTFESTLEKKVLKPLTELRMAYYTPPAIDNIRKIAEHFKANGSRVVLIAPIMLTDAPILSDTTLEKLDSSLPEWTHDKDILKQLNARFSEELTKLAQTVGTDIVNASDWLKITVNNQDAFYDNRHLTSSGAQAFSYYLALPLRTAVDNKLGQDELDALFEQNAKETAEAEAAAKAAREAEAQVEKAAETQAE